MPIFLFWASFLDAGCRVTFLTIYSGAGIVVRDPDKTLAPTQWYGQKGLLQCITDTTVEAAVVN